MRQFTPEDFDHLKEGDFFCHKENKTVYLITNVGKSFLDGRLLYIVTFHPKHGILVNKYPSYYCRREVNDYLLL